MFTIMFFLSVLLCAMIASMLSPTWLLNGKPKTPRQHKTVTTGFFLVLFMNACAWFYVFFTGFEGL